MFNNVAPARPHRRNVSVSPSTSPAWKSAWAFGAVRRCFSSGRRLPSCGRRLLGSTVGFWHQYRDDDFFHPVAVVDNGINEDDDNDDGGICSKYQDSRHLGNM